MTSPTNVPPGGSHHSIGPWRHRFLARGLDSAIVLYAWAAIAVEVDGRLMRGDLLGRSPVEVPRWRLVTILALVLLVTDVLPTVIFGRSLGKAVSDLRVVSGGGSHLVNPLAAAVRTGVLWAPLMLGTVGLGLIAANMAITALTNRGVHDRIGGTAVVQLAVTRPARLGPQSNAAGADPSQRSGDDHDGGNDHNRNDGGDGGPLHD